MGVDINLFTAAMRSEFLNAMAVVGEPAPIDIVTTEIKSTARLENYAWMSPSPGISRYVGHRRLANLSSIKYTLENLEYDGSFSVKLRDLDDDQVGGYKLRMRELVQKAGAPFRTRELLRLMANGQTTLCFDNSNFYAMSHNLGGYESNAANFGISGVTGGGNLLTVDPAASDGITHCMTVSVVNSMLNPFIYQNRKPPEFNTDAGTPASKKAKKADYWIDLEAGFGFGYWWDSVMVKFTDTPTVVEFINGLDAAYQALMRFSLPKSLSTDPYEYPHEQLQPNAKNLAVTCSVGLQTIASKALNDTYYGVTTAATTANSPSGFWADKYTLIHSNWLNSVV